MAETEFLGGGGPMAVVIFFLGFWEVEGRWLKRTEEQEDPKQRSLTDWARSDLIEVELGTSGAAKLRE